ncbi:hypothetical protein C491_07013 [Natronococcus amylolyticus DSM 10524]|uniref:Uncharacterized protein n=1 Tax=Natronococcus amylolyticus DSM 10524 TaxID=1227497 RepID=L9XFU9_9EURY|nr:hypothetical protein [Natronococcus amylolyticus]ELY59538.1 hypothetical protein C491_07013 [Natronococcus amylolyticus DSM 10524]
MALQRMLSGDPSKSSKLYIAIGLLSLAKAIVVYKDRNRFRRELIDAALFLGVGITLRKYSQLKAEKREEIESQVPDWLASAAQPEAARQGVRSVAKRKLAGEPEPEPEPTFRDRARDAVSR